LISGDAISISTAPAKDPLLWLRFLT